MFSLSSECGLVHAAGHDDGAQLVAGLLVVLAVASIAVRELL